MTKTTADPKARLVEARGEFPTPPLRRGIGPVDFTFFENRFHPLEDKANIVQSTGDYFKLTNHRLVLTS